MNIKESLGMPGYKMAFTEMLIKFLKRLQQIKLQFKRQSSETKVQEYVNPGNVRSRIIFLKRIFDGCLILIIVYNMFSLIC